MDVYKRDHPPEYWTAIHWEAAHDAHRAGLPHDVTACGMPHLPVPGDRVVMDLEDALEEALWALEDSPLLISDDALKVLQAELRKLRR